VGISQTIRRWTEGATYILQGDHHVGHWPTFLVYSCNVSWQLYIGSISADWCILLPLHCEIRPKNREFEWQFLIIEVLFPLAMGVDRFACEWYLLIPSSTVLPALNKNAVESLFDGFGPLTATHLLSAHSADHGLFVKHRFALFATSVTQWQYSYAESYENLPTIIFNTRRWTFSSDSMFVLLKD